MPEADNGDVHTLIRLSPSSYKDRATGVKLFPSVLSCSHFTATAKHN